MNKTLKITGEELKRVIGMDPDWIRTNATKHRKVLVTSFCDLSRTGITALSPFIKFAVPNTQGICGNFTGCTQLKIAEGTFEGEAIFDKSGVEKIGALTISRPNHSGTAADFSNCPNLKEARGTYPGNVRFANSGIERITDLKVTSCDYMGFAAIFSNCQHLKTLRGEYRGDVVATNSGIEEVAKNLDIKTKTTTSTPKLNLIGCEQLTRCPERILKDPKVLIDRETLIRLGQLKKAREAMKATPTIEF